MGTGRIWWENAAWLSERGIMVGNGARVTGEK